MDVGRIQPLAWTPTHASGVLASARQSEAQPGQLSVLLCSPASSDSSWSLSFKLLSRAPVLTPSLTAHRARNACRWPLRRPGCPRFAGYMLVYLFVRTLSQSGFLYKRHDQEASWGGKDLFGLHFHTAVHHQRKSGLELTQGRNIRQGLMQRP